MMASLGVDAVLGFAVNKLLDEVLKALVLVRNSSKNVDQLWQLLNRSQQTVQELASVKDKSHPAGMWLIELQTKLGESHKLATDCNTVSRNVSWIRKVDAGYWRGRSQRSQKALELYASIQALLKEAPLHQWADVKFIRESLAEFLAEHNATREDLNVSNLESNVVDGIRDYLSWIKVFDHDDETYPTDKAEDKDVIESLDLLTCCLAVTHWKNREHHGGQNNKVIVYGGFVINNQITHSKMQKAIDAHTSFNVANDSFGLDPAFNILKSCAVMYKQNGFTKLRWARESRALKFVQDVISITYGPKNIYDHAVYTNLWRCLVNRETFLISNETLNGDTDLDVLKTCTVVYRGCDGKEYTAKAAEGQCLDFAHTGDNDIISITYGRKDILDQAVFENLWMCVMKRETFLVSNETLNGDPEYGVPKTCKVVFWGYDGKKYIAEASEDQYLDFAHACQY